VEQGQEHRLLGPDRHGRLLTDAAQAAGAYEQVAYPGYAYPQTHPAQLEAVARLFGLDPPPARDARVLEVGCGDGGNVLAIAQTLPQATVVGIDRAAGPLQGGRALAAAAGLDNVDLRAVDLLDEAAMADLGAADYVIAHGVYSWIPPAARGALLAHCGRALAPHGVAFVSFNAYPGSYLRDMARDILAYHLRGVVDPAQRLAGARELMEAIVTIESPSPFARVLREHLQRMLGAGEALLYHDDLAEVSTPFYLHEVIDHAATYGLQFLSEAELADSQMHAVPASVGELMSRLPADVVVREQYLDFFRNRMFRQTLLVRAEVTTTRRVDDAIVEALAVAAPLRREDSGFVTDAGAVLTTGEPLIEAALADLGDRWPQAIGFGELVQVARGRLRAGARARAGAGAGARAAADSSSQDVVAELRNVLVQAFAVRATQLLGCRLPTAAGDLRDVGDRPSVSPLARAQARTGRDIVSTLAPGNHAIADPAERDLLIAADGTLDRPSLGRLLSLSPADLDSALSRLARVGLLLACPPAAHPSSA
jgi:SAM-dependent methyltransferase